MPLDEKQANSITSAVWLVGIGYLIWSGDWWPGILFLIGIAAIAQAFVEGRGRASWHAGLGLLGFGAWVLSGFNIFVLFVLLAAGGLAEAFLVPSSGKPAPDPELIDDRL
jgi:hypothetical protein